jgi:hypothetical protein
VWELLRNQLYSSSARVHFPLFCCDSQLRILRAHVHTPSIHLVSDKCDRLHLAARFVANLSLSILVFTSHITNLQRQHAGHYFIPVTLQPPCYSPFQKSSMCHASRAGVVYHEQSQGPCGHHTLGACYVGGRASRLDISAAGLRFEILRAHGDSS